MSTEFNKDTKQGKNQKTGEQAESKSNQQMGNNKGSPASQKK